ncbi:MAG: LPS assembly protein LptD [Candidatus Edwardsbacteria bacterium]
MRRVNPYTNSISKALLLKANFVLLILPCFWTISVFSSVAPQSLGQEEPSPDSLFAKVDTTGKIVRYEADTMQYKVKENLIFLLGNAKVYYRYLRLEADSIEFNTESQLLKATGNPKLWDRDEKIEGDKLIYSLKTERGAMLNGKTQFEKGFYWGKCIRKVGERVLNVDRGTFTTCNHNPPHYYFWSWRMKIYLDDKAIAEPVVLCIEGIPILAVPFWFFPIKKERHSGFLIPRVGQTENEGRYIKNIAYYLVLGPYADATLSYDYLEKIGWGGAVEGRFIYGSLISSQLNTSYVEESRKGPLRKRWSLSENHSQTLPFKIQLLGNANFISDQTYYREFGEQRIQRMVNTLNSNLSLSRTWSGISASCLFNQNRNLQSSTRHEDLPQICFSLFTRPLLRIMYASFNSFYINSRDMTPGQKEIHQGLDQQISISSTPKLFGWLSFSPRLGLYQTWYDRDRLGKKNAFRHFYDFSFTTSTNFYGYFEINWDKLKTLRHIVSPQVSYNYAPKIDQSKFYSFGGIREFGQQKSMSFSLSQKLQAKVKSKNKELKYDLMALNSFVSYNFLQRQPHRLSELNSQLTPLPGSRQLQTRITMTHNLPKKKLTYYSITTTLNISSPTETKTKVDLSVESQQSREEAKSTTVDTLEETETPMTLPWNLYLTHNYSKSSEQPKGISSFNAHLQFNLTKNWQIDYYLNYNLATKKIVSQDWSVYRDLHCWEARFSRQSTGERWWYEFRINIKALPEIKYERKGKRE